MEQVITLIIDGKGNVEIDTAGFTGTVCEKAATQLLAGLNGTVVEDKKKPEYYTDGDAPVGVLQGLKGV